MLPKRRELSNPRGRSNQRDMLITDGKPRAAYFERRSNRGVARRSAASRESPAQENASWRGSSTLIRRSAPRWRLSTEISKPSLRRAIAERTGPISPGSNGRNGRLSPFIIAQNGLWPCAAMAGHTRPARSLGVGKRLPGNLRCASDKRQESHYTGGGDGNERHAQRPLQHNRLRP